MKNQRFFWIMLFAVIAMMVLSLSGSVLAEIRGVTDDTIKIGMVMVKTGPVATIGKPHGDGIVDYYQYINEQGGVNGRKIECIWEDDQHSAPKSVAAVKKLITREKVLTIMVIGGTQQLMANLANVKRYKLTNIPNSMAAEFFLPVNPYIFGMGSSYTAMFQTIVDYIKNDLKMDEPPRIGVVFPNAEWGKESMNAVVNRAGKYNIPVVAKLDLPTNTIDASSQVLALQKSGANIVINCGLIPSNIALLKAAQKYGFTPKFFGGNWSTDDMLVRACGEGAKNYMGVNFVGGWWDDSPGVRLAHQLAKKYNRQPKITAQYCLGVGHAWIFTEAIKRAGKNLNPDTLRDAMESLTNFESGGLLPPVNYSPQNHSPANMVKFFKADVPQKRLISITGWRKPKDM